MIASYTAMQLASTPRNVPRKASRSTTFENTWSLDCFEHFAERDRRQLLFEANVIVSRSSWIAWNESVFVLRGISR